MPFASRRSILSLTPEDRATLTTLSRSRTEPRQMVERAQMMLGYADGESISTIARALHTSRPRIERCIDKALQIGPVASLADLPGRGRPVSITPEARAWVTSLACQKPKDLGYSYELWTTQLLSSHVRKTCRKRGHPSLLRLARGTVSKILKKNRLRPHKVRYYLERRDPEFDSKMIQVLYLYKEAELLREVAGATDMVPILSYDEKPGIQAIESTGVDLPPVPGRYPSVARDHEYVRHGTVRLLAGIDLVTGVIHGLVRDRHRSKEFIEFLGLVDGHYPPGAVIRIVMDNHSAHISRETRRYLATVPNRFQFVFTPKHGSWLNLIETFFSKMARTMLRGIRVRSKAELKERIEKYLEEVNELPVVFRWKYRLESL